MIKPITGIILIFFMSCVCSCSGEVSVDQPEETIDLSGERVIRIVFSLPGDDIGSPEDQIVLNRIVTSIRDTEAGVIISSGFGMGNMEINMKIKGDESIKIIKTLITDNYPDADYYITKPMPRH